MSDTLKIENINSAERLALYIEGIINDYDNLIYDKDETIGKLSALVLRISELNAKKITEKNNLKIKEKLCDGKN